MYLLEYNWLYKFKSSQITSVWSIILNGFMDFHKNLHSFTVFCYHICSRRLINVLYQILCLPLHRILCMEIDQSKSKSFLLEIWCNDIVYSRFVVVCGDGEYIIYTAMALRNKSFGSAQEFVWSNDSSMYAIRDGSSMLKIFKNFKEQKSFKPDFGAEGEFLLCSFPPCLSFLLYLPPLSHPLLSLLTSALVIYIHIMASSV